MTDDPLFPFHLPEPVRRDRRRSPRPPVPRHDGFSPAQQRTFLATLAETGSVTRACAAAGVSRTTAYNHRHDARAIDFREGWRTAIARAAHVMVDLAFERAVDGVEEPVFHAGREVGTRIRHDARLLRFLVSKRYLFAPVTRVALRDGTVFEHERYDAAALAGHVDRIDPPAGPAAASIPTPRARESLSTSSTSPARAEAGPRAPAPPLSEAKPA